MSYGFVTMVLLLPIVALATPWIFQEPVDIKAANGPGIFYHLGSGGRMGIAVSAEVVGVAWEDNRDRIPRCYVALIDFNDSRRIIEKQVSGTGSAYEPALLGLNDGQFAVAWEEENGLWVRILTESEMGPATRVDGAVGAHASLAWQSDQGLVVVWSRKDNARYRTWLAFVDLSLGLKKLPIVTKRVPVDVSSSYGEQTYPSAVYTDHGRLVIAWEDRHPGHTVIMAAHQKDRGQFSLPKQINESFWGGRELGFGRGTGAMRVSLASPAGGEVIAVWADKRDFKSGYDVYAAFSLDGGTRFGENEKVQDAFADGIAQWHPNLASDGSNELTVVSWDDDREDTPDVWISWHEGATWSADLDVPGASGDGVQTEPAITLDLRGGLHLAWVERAERDVPSRIRYLYAPRRSQ